MFETSTVGSKYLQESSFGLMFWVKASSYLFRFVWQQIEIAKVRLQITNDTKSGAESTNYCGPERKVHINSLSKLPMYTLHHKIGPNVVILYYMVFPGGRLRPRLVTLQTKHWCQAIRRVQSNMMSEVGT